jgi:hypothetical protein
MAATGYPSIDATVDRTNRVLKDIEEAWVAQGTPQPSYNALRAVLHTLRDRRGHAQRHGHRAAGRRGPGTGAAAVDRDGTGGCVVTGAVPGGELAHRATIHAATFGAQVTVPAAATGFGRRDGHYVVNLDDGSTVTGRTPSAS